MTSLVCCLSTGKGTWTPVVKLIGSEDWDRIFILTNRFGKENFTSGKPVELIVVDPKKGIEAMRDTLLPHLKGLRGTEVALNLESGTGAEHMAILSAILKAGYGFRLVSAGEAGMREV